MNFNCQFFLLIFIISIDLISAKSKGLQRRCQKTRCPDWSPSRATKRKTWQLEKKRLILLSCNMAANLKMKRHTCIPRSNHCHTMHCCILDNKLVWTNYIMSLAVCSTTYEITKIYLTILILRNFLIYYIIV